jgi:hypothetical protein
VNILYENNENIGLIEPHIIRGADAEFPIVKMRKSELGAGDGDSYLNTHKLSKIDDKQLRSGG